MQNDQTPMDMPEREQLERTPDFGPSPAMGPQSLDAEPIFTQPVQTVYTSYTAPAAEYIPPVQPAAPQPAQQPYTPPVHQPYMPPVQPTQQQAYTYGMPQQGYQPVQRPEAAAGKGLAISSMVLGIISILLISTIVLPLILGLIGLVLGIVGVKKKQGGMAVAGIVTSAIALGITLFIVIVALISVFSLY